MARKKATRQQAIARCRELGLRLFDDGATLTVDLPHGKVVKSVGVHYLTYDYDRFGDDCYLKSEAYAYLLEDLADGLEDCEDTDCDCCVWDLQHGGQVDEEGFNTPSDLLPAMRIV